MFTQSVATVPVVQIFSHISSKRRPLVFGESPSFVLVTVERGFKEHSGTGRAEPLHSVMCTILISFTYSAAQISKRVSILLLGSLLLTITIGLRAGKKAVRLFCAMAVQRQCDQGSRETKTATLHMLPGNVPWQRRGSCM
jgi:hypothetical protein